MIRLLFRAVLASLSLVLLSPHISLAQDQETQQQSEPALPIFDFSPQQQESQTLGFEGTNPTLDEFTLDPVQEAPFAERNDTLPAEQQTLTSDTLQPFGSQLFLRSNLTDRTIEVNDQYVIAFGDRIAIKVWGARNFQDVQIVDRKGNIFLPEIGAIRVAGVSNADLDAVVKASVARVFTDNVQIYSNLLGTQPINVFVTGSVKYPGQYPGGRDDNILYYLARAGAVDPERGSYRNISVIRNGQKIAEVDLYQFLLQGFLPQFSFESGDTILVEAVGETIDVLGDARNSYSFEFDLTKHNGAALVSLAQPFNKVSHAHVTGVREGKKYSSYVTLDVLKSMSLRGGDTVTFVEDYALKNLTINISGNSAGASSVIVPASTDLKTVLQLIEVDLNVADLNSIYIRRKSVATRQKEAINRSLYELQRSVLTGTASSSTESAIRIQEARLVDNFVRNVQAVDPEGRVVLNNQTLNRMKLEDGDEVVIPEKSDVVLITGEVKVPMTVVWTAHLDVDDYISQAGGLSNRGDDNNVLVLKRNGAVHNGDKPIAKGDHIMILPKVDTKLFARFKDVVEIIYRVALSSAVVLNAFDDD